MILADIKIPVIIMPERNIPRYVAILPVLFVASCLIGFYAPIPGKLEHFGKLIDAFMPFLRGQLVAEHCKG